MNDKSHETAETGAGEAPRKILSPAAKRALAEAQARREQAETEKIAAEREIGGRGGKDPARYGDWEVNGRAIDF
ncbi:MAG: DUF1674 domain-containing protein [Rhizobiales bacterium]|nr:DUF1674 domain-containing protein [Hyphomicrobiales bacterium]MBA70246.1 DUF1674 domain-containing protein [Hyphomicrobiales bacterium]